MGHTHIRLAEANEDILRGALHAGWKMRTEMDRKDTLEKAIRCIIYAPPGQGNKIEHRTSGKVGTRLMNTNYCEFPRRDCLSMFASAALGATVARGVAISQKKARLAW